MTLQQGVVTISGISSEEVLARLKAFAESNGLEIVEETLTNPLGFRDYRIEMAVQDPDGCIVKNCRMAASATVREIALSRPAVQEGLRHRAAADPSTELDAYLWSVSELGAAKIQRIANFSSCLHEILARDRSILEMWWKDGPPDELSAAEQQLVADRLAKETGGILLAEKVANKLNFSHLDFRASGNLETDWHNLVRITYVGLNVALGSKRKAVARLLREVEAGLPANYELSRLTSQIRGNMTMPNGPVLQPIGAG